MTDVRALRHETRRLIGRTLAKLQLHRLQFLAAEQGPLVRKTRRRLSWLAVACGNVYLRLHAEEVEVLHNDDWLRWEQAVAAASQQPPGAGPWVEGRGLTSPRWPGRPLGQILADPALTLGAKLTCVRLAVTALESLHQSQADWGGGRILPMSHADATSENVVVDTASCTARWIDFDTRHLPHIATDDRQADDLRALVFSAAADLPRSDYGKLTEQLVGACRRSRVLARFRERLANDWRRFSSFQLAQAPLSAAASRELCAVLLRGLPS